MQKKAGFYFGSGSAGVLFLLEILQVMQVVPIPLSVIVLFGVITVGFYAAGIWQWAGQFRHIQRSINERQVLMLRGVVTGLFVSVSLLAFILWHRMYPLPSSEVQETLGRYRRALGIDKNTGTTALIELTNGELKQKGALIYQKIRDMTSFYNKGKRDLQTRRDKKEIDEVKYQELEREHEAQATQEFNREIRTEAVMVRGELRNRIPEERRKGIVGLGLPDLMPVDSRAGDVSLYSVMPSPFSLHWADLLASELEELVKLLPDKG